MTFDLNRDYLLENDRVLLRPLAISDFQHLVCFSLKEPEIWKYSLIQAIGEEGLKAYLTASIEARMQSKEYPFIVFDKFSNQYAGCTRFYDLQMASKCVQLGFTWYGKNFQGTGLNKHCKYLLLDFAFGKLEMERVEFRADKNNERSIAAMKSIGCQVEGILRSNGYKADGTRRDSIVLSILKEEWNSKLKVELFAKL